MSKWITAILTITACSLHFSMAAAGMTYPPDAGGAKVKMPEDFQLSPEARERIEQTLQNRRSKLNMDALKRQTKATGGLDALINMKIKLPQADDGALPTHAGNRALPFFIDSKGRVRIELSVADTGDDFVKNIEDLGFEITLDRKEHGKVVVAASPGRLAELTRQLDAWPSVKRMRPVLRGLVHTGFVESEGDRAQGSFDAKKKLGVDGSGASVCVISDGIIGAEDAAASGDLPTNKKGDPAIETCPLNDNENSEGTAMLEIIHDVAPGAKLGFCPAFGNGQPGLVAAIEWLAYKAFNGKGCDIIVDDVAFLDEPYFQDGPVAQAVNRVTRSGVSYFTSAGNSAQRHYEHQYIDTAPDGSKKDLEGVKNPHDFGLAAGRESEIVWSGVVGKGTPNRSNFVAIFLQWNEAFGAAKSNYDILIFDKEGELAGTPESVFVPGSSFQGTNTQNGDGDPYEEAVVINDTGEEQDIVIVVDRISGKDHMLEMNFNSPNFDLQKNFNVPAGSVWGHAAARLGISVGATGAVTNINQDSNPDFDIIESFSSRGPAKIFFSADGKPRFERRRKPDLVAPDGVSVTGAGGFPETFYGTSASAPHAAAVAALLIDAADRDLRPWVIRLLLKYTADDRGKKGLDNIWGRGFIDAFEAVGLTSSFKK